MIKEKLQFIFNLEDKDYVNGIAEVTANFQIMELLSKQNLLNFEYSYHDGPTIQEFYDFLQLYFDKEILLKLFIIHPNREDFRIGVKGILIPQEYAKIEPMSNRLFYTECLSFSQKGNAHFYENKDYFGYYWFD